MRMRTAIAAVLALLLSSRAWAQAPDSAVLRARQIDLLQQNKVEIANIDGAIVGDRARLLPGERVVTIRLYTNLMPAGPLLMALVPVWYRAPADCVVSFRAEPGHRYVADVEPLSVLIGSCWVQDEDTSEKFRGVVSAQEPTMEDAE